VLAAYGGFFIVGSIAWAHAQNAGLAAVARSPS
jgi:drug/metabolite transporter superfamily protein YnfA